MSEKPIVNAPVKQHLIDPEICIRCYTCESSCPIEAISHNDDNVVVDADKCKFCMNCVAPCPTGAIDNWQVVSTPYSLDEQLSWADLPPQQTTCDDAENGPPIEALDDAIAELLAAAHAGTGGAPAAPRSAAKPVINLFDIKNPLTARVRGNFRLTEKGTGNDVRHIILDFDAAAFKFLEGQSIGIIPPGKDDKGRPFQPRLYSISCPRDGERPNTNNLSLTVKREKNGVCSNYICDLELGDEVKVTGPYGTSFLLPDDINAKLIMICTGTGSAPFRGFTMRRQRVLPTLKGAMKLFFGARSPSQLPYFGPLEKVPTSFLEKHFAFSRMPGADKIYVQDQLRADGDALAQAIKDPNTHLYICGLKAMEAGVESAFEDIAKQAGLNWQETRQTMRAEGRYHVETY